MGKKAKNKAKAEPAETQPEDGAVAAAEPASAAAEPVEPAEPVVEPTEPAGEALPEPKPVAAPAQPEISLHQQIGKLSAQLEATENERDEIQDQYEELLDKVGHIKATLGERLKKDAAELTAVKRELAELRLERDTLKKDSLELEQLRGQAKTLETKLSYCELQIKSHSDQSKDTESQVAQLTQDVAEQTRYAEHYRKSMQDAAKTAESEKRHLEAKNAELKSQAAQFKQQLEQEREANAKLEATISTQQHELEQYKNSASQIETLNETVREKTILIGKLRHEAVILNEHLTNALRIVKRDSEGQTVDKELVSNLIIQFVQLPRGDTKKFEVLQLIANFLSWDDERQVEVGLARQGGPAPQGSLGGFLGKFAEFMERESRKS